MIDHHTWNLTHILYHVGILILVIVGFFVIFHVALKFGLRRYKFKEKDFKEAGLNRRERRQKRAAAGRKKRR